MIVVGQISPSHYIQDISVIVPFQKKVVIPDDMARRSLHLAQALRNQSILAISLPSRQPVPTHIPTKSNAFELQQIRKAIEAQGITQRVDDLEGKIVNVDGKMDTVIGLIEKILKVGVMTSGQSVTTQVSELKDVPPIYIDVDLSSVESDRLVTQDESDDGASLDEAKELLNRLRKK